MTIFWLVLAVVLGVVEACTPQLVSIWFAVGALSGCVTSLLTDKIYIQIIVFVVVTVVMLILTRPLAKRLTKTSKTHTNSDRYIGKTAVVVTKIDNLSASGQVKVDNSVWSARSTENEVIDKDTKVVVKAIEGVKLIVEKI
ncbi:MAG: NfeD family protein [Ruminococcus sp.]|nr:NfeD family protein [Ruminococcus sp.]